jgi:hypothetical protein
MPLSGRNFLRTIRGWLLVLLLAWLPACCLAKAGDDPRLIVEALRCKGNVTTSCRSILDYVYLSPGDRLNEKEIQNAELRLSWLRNFSSVDIYLEKGSERGKVVVVVEVSERSALQREAALATGRLGATWTQMVAGRATDYDLFGAGKILDLQLQARIPISGPEMQSVQARLQYADPHLFDSQRYFLSAGVSRQDAHYNFPNGDSYEADVTATDVQVGRRVGDFNYVVVGVQYRPVSDVVCHIEQSNGTFQTFTFTRHATLLAGFGRNTLDDPNFPTSGTLLQLYFSGPPDCSDHLTFAFQKTWTIGAESFLTVGGQPGEFPVRYERRLPQSGQFRDIRRGRWYVGAGLINVQYGITEKGGSVRQFGLRAGIRFETSVLGIVDLSIFGTTNRRTGVLQ